MQFLGQRTSVILILLDTDKIPITNFTPLHGLGIPLPNSSCIWIYHPVSAFTLGWREVYTTQIERWNAVGETKPKTYFGLLISGNSRVRAFLSFCLDIVACSVTRYFIHKSTSRHSLENKIKFFHTKFCLKSMHSCFLICIFLGVAPHIMDKSCCLQGWYPIRAPVHVLIAPFPIQFLANVPWKVE